MRREMKRRSLEIPEGRGPAEPRAPNSNGSQGRLGPQAPATPDFRFAGFAAGDAAQARERLDLPPDSRRAGKSDRFALPSRGSPKPPRFTCGDAANEIVILS